MDTITEPNKGLFQKVYTNRVIPEEGQKLGTFESQNEPISIASF